jgi:hypothetical protein
MIVPIKAYRVADQGILIQLRVLVTQSERLDEHRSRRTSLIENLSELGAKPPQPATAISRFEIASEGAVTLLLAQ